jgi:hypothetical protein
MCRHMNQGFLRGLGGGGDPVWLHRETLTLKGPAAYQNTAVFQIGVNKIPPNFDTLFATTLCRSASLKGSLRDHFMCRSASKG